MTEEKPDKPDIDSIPGHTKILLIAPHGVVDKPFDDENTAELTQKIVDRLDCHHFINRTYRKPEGPEGETDEERKARNNGEYNVKEKVLDLNKFKQAELHPNFLTEIEEIVNAKGLTYVFWIHGIDDDNIISQAGLIPDFKKRPKHLHALIGYGQGPDRSIKEEERTEKENSDSLTIEKERAKKFAQLLTASGMNTELTSKEATDYCGRARDNMNQWFVQNKAKFPGVKSLQIEIRKDGFRDTKNLDTTAQKIADAISALVPPTVLEVVEEDPKVEKAYQHLKGIFVEHFQNAMIEVGQYLIDQFYNGDYEKAQQKQFTENKSLAKLIKRIQQDAHKKGDAPSRTWIYDAVNLAIDQHLFEQKMLPSVYGQLGHSHKVNLTYAPNNLIKGQLAEETVDKKLTVAKLRKRIRQERKKADGNDSPLNLFDLPSKEVLMLESVETLNSLKISAETKIQTYSDDLKKLKLAEKRIKNAIDTQKPTPAELRRAVKNNEWTLSRNNVNFSTGCSNACIYCYGRFMPHANELREKAEAQGKEFHWGNADIRQKDVETNYGLKDGRVGFPTSHDITPKNLNDYLTVLGKLLRADNRVMIITKPVLECIKAICEASAFFKDEILFRFTIGGKSEEVLSFWEPNAPSYEHRIECLKYAFDKGFQTSVSMEPMLEYSRAEEMVQDFMPYVSDAIWFGKMNHIPLFKDPDGRLKEELAKVEAGHADKNIIALHKIYKDNPKIKWKLAYKEVLGIPLPPAPGMDI